MPWSFSCAAFSPDDFKPHPLSFPWKREAKCMKAAVLREFKNPLAIEEMAQPRPAAGEVLIRIEACGVCHSDVHVADGDWSQFAKIVKTPLIPGHEIAGVVVDFPDAFYGYADQIVGQFPPIGGQQEQFGLAFAKGNSMVPCVNQAIAALKSNGTLQQLQEKWLTTDASVPVFS